MNMIDNTKSQECQEQLSIVPELKKQNVLSVAEREILIYVRKVLEKSFLQQNRGQHLVVTVGIQIKARQTSMGNISVWIPALIKGWIQWLKDPLPTLLSQLTLVFKSRRHLATNINFCQTHKIQAIYFQKLLLKLFMLKMFLVKFLFSPENQFSSVY